MCHLLVKLNQYFIFPMNQINSVSEWTAEADSMLMNHQTTKWISCYQRRSLAVRGSTIVLWRCVKSYQLTGLFNGEFPWSCCEMPERGRIKTAAVDGMQMAPKPQAIQLRPRNTALPPHVTSPPPPASSNKSAVHTENYLITQRTTLSFRNHFGLKLTR